MDRGLIHIYCGDGKGKTTSATGLAVRAAGCGMKVLFARFLKDETSGELRILDQIPEIEVLHLHKSYGFYWTLSDREKDEVRIMYVRLWEQICVKVLTDSFDMLVMDEFMPAYQYEMIPHKEAVDFLRHKPEKLEVVLTGQNPSDEILELADYVSDIHKVRHPFDKSIGARRGIEY